MKNYTYEVTVHDKNTLNELNRRCFDERIYNNLSLYKDFIKFENNIAYFKTYHGNYHIVLDGKLMLKLIYKPSYKDIEENEDAIEILINTTTEKLQKRDFDSAITLIEIIKKLYHTL